MEKRQTRQYEMLVRDFGAAHRERFPAMSLAADAFAVVASSVQTLSDHAVARLAVHRDGTRAKAAARREIADLMRAIGRTARVIREHEPGFPNTFRMPARKSAQALLTAARLFARDVPPVAPKFLAHAMPATFVAESRGCSRRTSTRCMRARRARARPPRRARASGCRWPVDWRPSAASMRSSRFRAAQSGVRRRVGARSAGGVSAWHRQLSDAACIFAHTFAPAAVALATPRRSRSRRRCERGLPRNGVRSRSPVLHGLPDAATGRQRRITTEVSSMKPTKAILAGAMVALSVAVAACDTSRTAQQDETAPGAAPPADAARASDASMPASEVASAPDRYLGQTVTVRGEVEKILSPMSFVLDDDGPDLNPDLLVFSPKEGMPVTIDDSWRDQTVRVTGTVGKMTVVEIEREVGWDLDPQVEAEVEGAAAVLIARSIQRMPE